MRVIAGAAERGPVASLTIVTASLGVLLAATVSGVGLKVVAPTAAAIAVLAVAHRTILAWRNLLGLMVVVILFVPMRKYVLPGGLPFELDLYRVLVAFILGGWIAALLADPRVRLRSSGLEGPLILIVVATVASIVANGSRVAAVGGTEVVKNLTFLLSYIVVFFIIVSVARKGDHLNALIKVVVAGGAILAGCAVVESRTHFNVFDHIRVVLPFLHQAKIITGPGDATRGYRAIASAQHPIALSAALVLMLPIAIYLGRRTRQRRWWLAAAVLLTGAMSTTSRTTVIMLFAVVATFVILRTRDVKRFWPALIPAVAIIHFALPGTLGTLKQSFFPRGGLVAQQNAAKGTAGQGRLADIGPAIRDWSTDPLFGKGYATRVVGAPGPDGQILDDQWLGTLLETGVPGLFGWLWLVVRAIRRFGRAAREDPGDEGWLLTSLTAAFAAFGLGMAFFDALAFIQVTVLFFILLAIACNVSPRVRRLALPSLG